jgi:hypothetical protein
MKNAEVKETKQPTLTCVVTGATRKTSRVYLEAKARNLGYKAKNLNPVIEKISENYVARPVLKLLRAGKTVAEVRKALRSKETAPITEAQLEKILEFNGKHSHKSTAVAA